MLLPDSRNDSGLSIYHFLPQIAKERKVAKQTVLYRTAQYAAPDAMGLLQSEQSGKAIGREAGHVYESVDDELWSGRFKLCVCLKRAANSCTVRPRSQNQMSCLLYVNLGPMRRNRS